MKPLLAPARLTRSMLSKQSDERLTQLARGGSELAFETLVARHRRSLVRHCTRVLGAADAEEAVQEALLRAHRALARGTVVHAAGPWLHTIARHTALNLLRARNARREIAQDRCPEAGAQEDRRTEHRQDLRDLIAAVGSLPARQRDAIVMREVEGRSYDEIARHLGASHGAVRQLLSRARSSIRSRLGAVIPGDWVIRGPGSPRRRARTRPSAPAPALCAWRQTPTPSRGTPSGGGTSATPTNDQ
jgi:RNA polymerase sigma factor (sigma-70 family)